MCFCCCFVLAKQGSSALGMFFGGALLCSCVAVAPLFETSRVNPNLTSGLLSLPSHLDFCNPHWASLTGCCVYRLLLVFTSVNLFSNHIEPCPRFAGACPRGWVGPHKPAPVQNCQRTWPCFLTPTLKLYGERGHGRS